MVLRQMEIERTEVGILPEALQGTTPAEEVPEVTKAELLLEVAPLAGLVEVQEAVGPSEAQAAEVHAVPEVLEVPEVEAPVAQEVLEVLVEVVPQQEDHLEGEAEEEDRFQKTTSTRKI